MAFTDFYRTIMRTRFLSSAICLFLAGAAMIYLGYLIREHQWGTYGWAMILGVLLLGGSFLLFLSILMRKMDYQFLCNDRAEKAKKRKANTDINSTPQAQD